MKTLKSYNQLFERKEKPSDIAYDEMVKKMKKLGEEFDQFLKDLGVEVPEKGQQLNPQDLSPEQLAPIMQKQKELMVLQDEYEAEYKAIKKAEVLAQDEEITRREDALEFQDNLDEEIDKLFGDDLDDDINALLGDLD